MSFFTWESKSQLWGHVFNLLALVEDDFVPVGFILSSSVRLGEDFFQYGGGKMMGI